MKLSPKGLAVGIAVLWGISILGTGIINLFAPHYGEHFLLTMSSIYPGYHATRTLTGVLVGTGYGIVDGAIAGFLVAWIYNLFAPEGSTRN